MLPSLLVRRWGYPCLTATTRTPLAGTIATIRTSWSNIPNPNPMTEKIIDNKWVDMTEICIRFDLNVQQVGNIARTKFRYVAADTIEFDLDGVTIRKVGKGKLARYRVISNPHSL
jgi:hypothetical protein